MKKKKRKENEVMLKEIEIQTWNENMKVKCYIQKGGKKKKKKKKRQVEYVRSK